MSIKDLLSASSTKKKLICLLGLGLLEYISSEVLFSLFVVYDTSIRGHNFDHKHTHESDILIPLQILVTVAEDALREICVWSPDTDVLLLLMDLVSSNYYTAHFSEIFNRQGLQETANRCVWTCSSHFTWKLSRPPWDTQFFWLWLGRKICENFQKGMD